MPNGIRGWAIWVVAQVVLSVAFKLLYKLAENAVIGWGDDQIAAYLGITSPSAATALSWALPVGLAAITLWIYHLVVTSPAAPADRGQRANFLSQIIPGLLAQVRTVHSALGIRAMIAWLLIIACSVGLIGSIAVLAFSPIRTAPTAFLPKDDSKVAGEKSGSTEIADRLKSVEKDRDRLSKDHDKAVAELSTTKRALEDRQRELDKAMAQLSASAASPAVTVVADPAKPADAPPIQVGLLDEKTGAGTGNPLWDKINAYLAKRGKSPEPTNRAPTLFAMGGSSHGEIYITRWDASLGPWPEVDDGFTSSELRTLPKKVPRFTTQYDKENFRKAVDALQRELNQKMGAIIRQSQRLGPIALTTDTLQQFNETLEQVLATYRELDAALFVRGSQGNGTFFDESYAGYKELLMGVFSDDWQVRWSNFNVARDIFSKSIALLSNAARHPDDVKLVASATTNTGIPKSQFMQETGRLREWLEDTNRRIEMVIRAI